MRIAERKILVNVGFYSEFPNKLKQIKDIVAEGASGFKLFMADQVGGLNINDDHALHEAFIEVGEANVPVAVHAEDHDSIASKVRELKAAKRDDPAAFLKAHSEQAELKTVERILKTSADTKARVHFCHMTTGEGLDRVVEAKKSGRKVTCEVTPNHLLLSSEDFERVGGMLTMMPPLRSKTQVDALWKGISEGSVDVLGSDHAPHTMEEKSASSIWDAKVGVPGLETTLPLMLTMVKKNRLTSGHACSLVGGETRRNLQPKRQRPLGTRHESRPGGNRPQGKIQD